MITKLTSFFFIFVAFPILTQSESDVVDSYLLESSLLLKSTLPISLPFSSNNFPSSFGKMRASSRPISWENCGEESNDLFRLESLEFIPDPPRRSSPLTVKLRGYLKERLEEVVVWYEVKFGAFK